MKGGRKKETDAGRVRPNKVRAGPFRTAAEEHANTLPEQAHKEMAIQMQLMQKGMGRFMKQGPKKRPTFQSPNEHPSLNLRAQGWLKHIWMKATTPDDWGRDGQPLPWWDASSGPPMTNYQRFDLHESSYSLAIMADQTPAWRECYSTILDELSRRYTTHWAAVDFLNQVGVDPDMKNYPNFWKGRVVPAFNFKEYHTPGWTSNGYDHKVFRK